MARVSLLISAIFCRSVALAEMRVLSDLIEYAGGKSLAASTSASPESEVQSYVVDCLQGSDLNEGSASQPFHSIQHAIDTALSGAAAQKPIQIEVLEGHCHLSAPLRLSSAGGVQHLVLRGRGPRSVVSGGKVVTGWKATAWPGAPANSVFVADVSGWPVEIKTLRHGSSLVPRARWPPLKGAGLTTPNWLFAASWSTHPPQSDGRQIHGLGLDPSKLPLKTNVSSLVGAYAHVLGCVENDVNSQLTKVLAVAGKGSEPSLSILFRNTFNVNQRFYLENVRWALSAGQFYHDEAAGKLYYWPASKVGRAIAEPIAGVVAPVLDRLIELDHANHHVISNITFTDTTYFADGYWDGPAQEPSDAAIRINYCNNVIVEACNFVGGLGGYGVAVGNESADILVTGSLFDSLGQGGVILYGYDHSPVPRHPGSPTGNNTKPRRVTVSHNVIQNLGLSLIHVAGVALRAASDCIVEHNRVHRTPRYGLEADSFYTNQGSPLISSGNLFQYNILSDTNRLTTDTGAIEMLGSGDPGSVKWWNNNTIRFNNITGTVGSSSSDGKNVCVHGVPDAGCRRLVWGIYLDGGEAGITIYGNIIGSSLHGAVFDNAGGNNTQINNVFLADAASPILMDFGAPGQGAPRSVAGNVVIRNIFYWRSQQPGTHRMYDSMDQWSPDFLKPGGADYNLFWSPNEDAAISPVFPGHKTLAQWQGRATADEGPATCTNMPGAEGTMVIAENCSWGFIWNSTDKKFRLKSNHSLVINIDCEGNWDNCAQGTANTRICLDTYGPWTPRPPPPAVDNEGWNYNEQTHELVAVASQKCVEVCMRGGDVGGCNGKADSIVQLAACTGSAKQKWTYNVKDETFHPMGLGTEAEHLCLGPPSRAAAKAFDNHSLVADPLFINPDAGNFSLDQNSPALTRLGFKSIPPIEAPVALCGGPSLPSCLSLVMNNEDTGVLFV